MKKDLLTNGESSGRMYAFDDFRFIAISLVVASHSRFLLQGGLGNDFFAISVFLLYHHFKYLSCKGIASFYIGRMFRILPVF